MAKKQLSERRYIEATYRIIPFMTGSQLETFCTELNGGASIGPTFLFQLLNLSKAMVEQRRPWMALRSTDSSVSVAAGSTWQTAISLAGIARFSRFYGDYPIKLYANENSFSRYSQRPLDQRLYVKGDPNTFCYDETSQTLYLNGSVPYGGTLWIDHIKDSPDITDDDSSSWVFPSWSHPLLGFMAVAMNKGGVDYDDTNARMAADNRAQAEQIMQMLLAWDNEKQLASIATGDPYCQSGEFRSGAINI